MVDLYELISDLCDKKGISGGKMCADIGVSRSFMTELKKGRAKTITFATAQKLADYFNVNVSYFNFESDKIPEGFLPLPATKKVPRLGVISCGDPINSEENFEGYDDVPEHIACDFTLKCEGDSMIGARINDGDLVYIRQQSTVENGQIAAVLIDGTEKLLKRVYINDDSVILQAENPVYPPRVYSKEDMNRVSIIGRAVGFTSILR